MKSHIVANLSTTNNSYIIVQSLPEIRCPVAECRPTNGWYT